MLITDLIIAIVFTVGIAVILFLNEDKIQVWANSKHGKRIKW